MTSRKPGIGQATLPEMQPTIDLDRKVAVGSILKPEYFGYGVEDFEAIGQAELDMINLPEIWNTLNEYPRRRGARRRPGEEHPISGAKGLRVDGLALNEAEYDLFPRNIESLGKAALAKTMRKRKGGDVANVEAAAERSKMHTYETKKERLDEILEGLEKEADYLRVLRKETIATGYAHKGWAEMKMLAVWVWQNSFTNMLNVVGNERGWTPEQRETAHKALGKYILDGPQRQRAANLLAMTKMAILYNHRRQRLAELRSSDLGTEIELIKEQQGIA